MPPCLQGLQGLEGLQATKASMPRRPLRVPGKLWSERSAFANRSISKVVIGFLNFGYEFLVVVGDVWGQLCRHAPWKISAHINGELSGGSREHISGMRTPIGGSGIMSYQITWCKSQKLKKQLAVGQQALTDLFKTPPTFTYCCRVTNWKSQTHILQAFKATLGLQRPRPQGPQCFRPSICIFSLKASKAFKSYKTPMTPGLPYASVSSNPPD